MKTLAHCTGLAVFTSLLLGTGCVIVDKPIGSNDETGDADGDTDDETDGNDDAETGETGETEGTTDDTTDDTGETTDDTTDDTGETTDDTTETGDECAPQDAAQGPEDCWNPNVWFWNGEACEQITCECVGSECGEAFSTEGECVEAYAECGASECAADDAYAEGACELILGHKWNGESCEILVGCECVGTDCDALFDSNDACEAFHEPCAGNMGACDPYEAAGEGPCDLELGFMWTGEACVSISGCECVGADCDLLWEEQQGCEDAHADC